MKLIEHLAKLQETYLLRDGREVTTLFFLIQLKPNIRHAKNCLFPGNYNFRKQKDCVQADSLIFNICITHYCQYVLQGIFKTIFSFCTESGSRISVFLQIPESELKATNRNDTTSAIP